MAPRRRVIELAISEQETETLTALSRSRSEPASRVSRAAMLLAYHDNPSFFAVARRLGVHHQTVQRCIERAESYGPLAALDDRPRPGKEPVITPEAKAWLVSLACDKARDHGYPHELWTTRLLARHAREHGPGAGHPCLARLVQGTVSKLLSQEQIKPHKMRYYLERRDGEFEQKMAEVLCVYRQVQVLKKAAARSDKSAKRVAILSYDVHNADGLPTRWTSPRRFQIGCVSFLVAGSSSRDPRRIVREAEGGAHPAVLECRPRRDLIEGLRRTGNVGKRRASS